MKESIPLPTQDYMVNISCMTYNHEKYIEDALKGFVIQKTNFPFCALVIDDASTDGTADVIRKYENKYPNIIKAIYLKENHYSQKRSKMPYYKPWRERSKYIALCEGDDFWIDPYKLQKQVDFLENNPVYTVIGHNAIELHEENKNCNLFNNKLLNSEYTIEDIILNDWFIPTASLLFRKSTLQEREYNKTFKNGDYYLQLRLLLGGEKLYYSNEIMSVYRKHSGGISNTFTTEILLHNLFELFNHINEITNYIYNDSIEIKKQKLNRQLLEEQRQKKVKESFKYKFIVTISNVLHRLLKI